MQSVQKTGADFYVMTRQGGQIHVVRYIKASSRTMQVGVIPLTSNTRTVPCIRAHVRNDTGEGWGMSDYRANLLP